MWSGITGGRDGGAGVMAMERGERDELKRVEIHLDTAQLLIAFGIVLGICGACFYLGRWVERSEWATASAKPASPGAVGADTAAGKDLTFFDTLGDKAAEPGRQARGAAASAAGGGREGVPAGG